MTEDEMVRQHHQLKQTPGESEGQGSWECYSPWGCQESDTTQQLRNDNKLGFSAKHNDQNQAYLSIKAGTYPLSSICEQTVYVSGSTYEQ